MQVLNLRLYQYRNFDLQEIEFCPGTNLLYGQNGQGKTNLLEAIYLLGYGRSFRTATPRDCIQHGRQECRLEGKIQHGTTTRDLGISISLAEEKQLLLYRKPVGWTEFIGNLHTLAFTQEHMKVVRGGPVERRAFLDRAMITAYPGHMQRLAAYNRALRQRNHLLGTMRKSAGKTERELLESWDEKLAREGSRILWNRRRYIEEMSRELVNPLCRTESLEIRYSSIAAATDAGAEEIEGYFRQSLRKARSIDESKGFTTVGPHRDDLMLMLDGKPLADFGSAGQQRSCLLALYFVQMEIHRRICGFYPVFLMDDVEAELDNERLQAFLDHLSRRTQTFLTTAKEQVLPRLDAYACRLRVHAGKVDPDNS
ncbi:MAG: DNA replication/repair protein RecF [Acidobacteriia bacterium]|nr:DNA replication/repair protein RecF [Terriglobia bacterium]